MENEEAEVVVCECYARTIVKLELHCFLIQLDRRGGTR